LALRKTYVPNRLTEVDWAEQPNWMHALFDCFPNDRPSLLSERSVAELVTVIKFSESLHEQDLLFAAFDVMLRITPLMNVPLGQKAITTVATAIAIATSCSTRLLYPLHHHRTL
jgi:hypothetical protein